MTKNKRMLLFFSRMAAMSALFLLMLFAGSQAAYAAEYDLYIGSTRVTDANAGDILGNGTARYDAGTKTLYLNGVHIGADNYYEYLDSRYSREKNAVNRYSLYAGTDVVKHLVITGENSFESAMADVLYTFDAAEVDEDYWAVDVTGDGKITLDDAKVETEIGNNGIYFSVSSPSSGQEWSDHSLMITGTGTLTSKATTPTLPDKCRVYDVYGFDSHDVVPVPPDNTVNTGTAMTVEGGGGIYMGNTDGTGPTLKLTGWNKGANFYNNNSRFVMQGGTIIAEAKEPTEGIGVALPAGSEGASYFEGGTIAGYGAYAGDQKGGAFSSPGRKDFEQPNAKTHKMQRVYPETVENDSTTLYDNRPTKIFGLSGWVVVGMTAEGFKDQTDAVLQELSLDGSGGGTDPTNPDDPGGGGGTSTGEKSGGSQHTDIAPDSTDIDVWGYAENTVYSVDVEWGAMTFEYEANWNPSSHQMEGGDWKIYDSATNTKIESTQHNINKVTITNHSNASVYAKLSYTAGTGYTDTNGKFSNSDKASTENVKATWNETNNYFTLETAANADGSAGDAAKGNVYFMPNGISDAVKTSGITKWTKIGKITVGILTEQP